ncbi:competence type IV pilus minor pilin ComGG [Shouchella sp. 1P09AA]|uniref:competence type IV pilus minor pilin ComGG n=1 Tax=unclassified Shouchella TaxID=2893065 RepID=UPI0039A3310D
MFIKQSDEGLVFLPTLFFLLLLTIFLLWQMNQYQREHAYMIQQHEYMQLENLLHLGLQQALDDDKDTIHISVEIGEVSVQTIQQDEKLIKLTAVLENGKKRTATVTLEKSGEISSYKEGL